MTTAVKGTATHTAAARISHLARPCPTWHYRRQSTDILVPQQRHHGSSPELYCPLPSAPLPTRHQPAAGHYQIRACTSCLLASMYFACHSDRCVGGPGAVGSLPGNHLCAYEWRIAGGGGGGRARSWLVDVSCRQGRRIRACGPPVALPAARRRPHHILFTLVHAGAGAATTQPLEALARSPVQLVRVEDVVGVLAVLRPARPRQTHED